MIVVLVMVLRAFGLLCVLRFLLQLSGANVYNPIVSAFAKITNPVLQPLRRFLPKHRLIDFSSGVVVLIIHVVVVLLSYPSFARAALIHIPIIFGVLSAIKVVCVVYIVGIILTVIMSWVAPNVYSPATEIAHVLTEPILRPIRKVLPAMAGFDFSPMLALLGLFMIVSMLPRLPI